MRLLVTLMITAMAGASSGALDDLLKEFVSGPIDPFFTGADADSDVFLLEADMDGDGGNEIFLSREGFTNGSEGLAWFIYTPEGDHYIPLRGFAFHPKAFFVGEMEGEGRGLVCYYHNSAFDGALVMYRLVDGDIVKKNFGIISPKENEEDRALYERLFMNKDVPQIKTISVAEIKGGKEEEAHKTTGEGVPTAMSAASPGPEAYLFAHMLKEEYGRLRYSVSRDGLQWTLLNEGKRVFEEYQGHPDICKGHDGRYYLIGNRSNQPEITIWVSNDLVAWSRHTEFTPSFEGIPNFTRGEHHNGAPKIYYDEPSATYLVTWHAPMERASKEEPERMWASMRTLYVTSKDLTSFSEPRRLFEFEMATIDVIVRPDGRKYCAVIKDERYPSAEWPTGKTIRVCVGNGLLGPYGPPSAPITRNFREAPTVVPQPGGRGWYMYCEEYPAKSYECFRAPRLDGPWEQVPPAEAAAPARARHGCMITITPAQCDALLAAFPATAKPAESTVENER